MQSEHFDEIRRDYSLADVIKSLGRKKTLEQILVCPSPGMVDAHRVISSNWSIQKTPGFTFPIFFT